MVKKAKRKRKGKFIAPLSDANDDDATLSSQSSSSSEDLSYSETNSGGPGSASSSLNLTDEGSASSFSNEGPLALSGSYESASDQASASTAQTRSTRRRRRVYSEQSIRSMAKRASDFIFDRVKPKVAVPDAGHLPTLAEAIAEDFMRTCFGSHAFNCVSVSIHSNRLTFTANSNSGYEHDKFLAYKRRHEARGWRVSLVISSQETDCYRHGRRSRKRAEKHLHAEIQQWTSIVNFEQADFGPNKLCCFYCASILLAVQNTGQGSHWRIQSHGKVYDYTLPSILYSARRLGAAYFGEEVYLALARASQRSRQRFETLLKQMIRRRVRHASFGKAHQTRVQHATPPPSYSDYQRSWRTHASDEAKARQSSSSSSSSRKRRRRGSY